MKHAFLLLKITISVLLLALVVSLIDLGALTQRAREISWGWLGLSLVALLAQFIISVLRWRTVCTVFNLPLSVPQALSLGFMGQLFNQVLPTNVGGDGIRVLAMSRRGWVWSDAARTVLVDRAIGILFILGAAFVSLLVALITGHPDIPGGGLLLALLGGGLAAILVMLTIGTPIIDRQQGRFAILKPIAWGLNGLRMALSDRQRTPRILTKALLVHLILMQSFCFAAAAVGVEVTRDLVLIMALVILGGAVPLSFAGWGVREGAAVTGLALLGVDPTDAVLVSLLHGVSQIVIGLPGIVPVPGWLFGRGEV